MNKRAGTILFGIILVLAFGAAVSASEKQADPGGKDGWSLTEFEEKWFYTRVNIFYEKARRIYSTNYHKGKTLPAGSKVLISFAQGREVEFRDSKGGTYILVLKRKHASESTTLRTYFEQHFSAEDPLRTGSPYDRFTDAERWNIRNGTIEKGMSRAAVLMAYGYPPSHETPSLEDDKWTYWIGSLHGKPINVYFRDDRVYRIITQGRMTTE